MEKETISKGEIAIYTSSDGKVSIDAKLKNETIWLTQEQIAQLFDVKRPAITKHINSIYKECELDEQNTCSILEHMGNNTKQTYFTKYYNLDAIIAVGYRVNSKRATQFRIWSTNILKEYLVQGYVVNQQNIQEHKEKLAALQQVVELLNRSIENQIKTVEQAQNISKILNQFVKGLNLLDDFDHKRLDNKGQTKREAQIISVEEFLSVIDKMKGDFASDVFAQPKDDSFNSSVNQIYQKYCYT